MIFSNNLCKNLDILYHWNSSVSWSWGWNFFFLNPIYAICLGHKMSGLLSVSVCKDYQPSLAVFLLTVIVSLYVTIKVSCNGQYALCKCFLQAHCQNNIVQPALNINGQNSNSIKLRNTRKNTSIHDRYSYFNNTFQSR